MKIKTQKPNFKKLTQDVSNTKKDVFIVNPWANKKKVLDSTFPAHQPIHITLSYTNPLPFAFCLNSLELDVDGVACIKYPTPLSVVKSNGELTFTTLIKPIEEGVLRINGVRGTFLNYTYLHQIDERGFFCGECKNELFHDFHNIIIVE